MSSNPANKKLAKKKKDLELKPAADEKGAVPQLIPEEFRRLANRSRDMIFRYDLTTRRFVFVNNTFLEFYGIDAESGREATTKSVLLSIYPEDLDKVKKAQKKSLAPGSTGGEVEYRLIRPDGSLHWMHDQWIVITDETGNPVTIEGIVRDITDRKRVEEELKASKDFIEAVLDNMMDPLIVIDPANYTILEANKIFINAYGLDKDAVIGKHCYELTHNRSTPCSAPNDICPLAETLETGKHSTAEHIHYDSTGSKLYVEVSTTPIISKGGEIHQIIHLSRDITDRKRMEEEILEMSLRDQMTELYNRRGFITLAEQQIRAANRARRSMLLTFIDLDGLKWINDTLGHEEGDRALIDTANVLRQTFRESDIIARLGGDEFAVLSIDAADMNPEDFSKRLQENIDAGNAKETRPYKLAMSWGAAVYDPGSPLSLDELMSSADERMYAQKKAKSNRRI